MFFLLGPLVVCGVCPVNVATANQKVLTGAVHFYPRVVFRCNYKVPAFGPIQCSAVSEGQVANVKANVKTLHTRFSFE